VEEEEEEEEEEEVEEEEEETLLEGAEEVQRHVRGVRAALGTNFIRVGAIGKAWRGENGRVRSSRTPIHIRPVRIQHNQCAT
jgi:hypothetical protein